MSQADSALCCVPMDVVGVTRLFSSHSLIPALNQRSAYLSILNRFNYAFVHRRTFYTMHCSRPSMFPRRAIAKRGFSPKEDEVASCKLARKSHKHAFVYELDLAKISSLVI